MLYTMLIFLKFCSLVISFLTHSMKMFNTLSVVILMPHIPMTLILPMMWVFPSKLSASRVVLSYLPGNLSIVDRKTVHLKVNIPFQAHLRASSFTGCLSVYSCCSS